MSHCDLESIATGADRAPATPGIATFNNQGPEALSEAEVLEIGDSISERLSALGQPGLGDGKSISDDESLADFIVSHVRPSTITIGDRTITLYGDSGVGKSAAGSDMRTFTANKLGLNVSSGDPESLRKFVALATRYATLTEVRAEPGN